VNDEDNTTKDAEDVLVNLEELEMQNKAFLDQS
jgi:hypothetical protein